MFKSVMSAAKLILVFLNIWVLAVVLVVSLGHWRVFETNDSAISYDSSHLVVMRKLKDEEGRKLGQPGSNASFSHGVNPIAPFSAVVPAGMFPNPVLHNQRPSIVPVEASFPASSKPVEDGRVANLRHWCNQQHPLKTPYENISKTKLTSILVDERNKLLFCQIPGVAINEWRKIMLILSGVVNVTNTDAISGGDVYGKYAKNSKRLSDYGDKERNEMLRKYYKVIFVRDPLERLVIAYRTKLINKASKYFHRAFGTLIIKKYRKNASAAEINAGTNVLFSEFVRFIIDNDHSGTDALNEHWQQYYKQCHPCLVNYDFVGMYESVEADIKVVLEKLKATKVVKPPYVTDTKTVSHSELTKVYSEIKAPELNNLFKVYAADYTLFGYRCPRFVHDLLQKGHIFHDY